MDPTKGQDSSPQRGRTPPRVRTPIHNVDGPNKGQKFKKNSQNGRTPRRVKTSVHNVDRPDKGKKLK